MRQVREGQARKPGSGSTAGVKSPVLEPGPESDEIAEDYGSRVRIAREQMKIPVRVLAEMLNEKEGLIKRVEQQKTLPPEALRKKLEKALGIRLGEAAPSESSSYHGAGKAEEATLGEFVA